MQILQVGLGGFGRNHLRAWAELGLTDSLWVAERSEELHQHAVAAGVPRERITTDYRAVLSHVDAVDVVTGSESHFEICSAALEAGRHTFVEKPMTMTVTEATALDELVTEAGRALQVGFYYRYHPISRWLRQSIREGLFGEIRYISGVFMGFKRARTDVGVVHTDGIHFLDLFNWLLGEPPVRVDAVVRDHFGRGMEDLGLVTVEYPGGTLGRVEAGYIQPGKWRDKVVPNAFTSKEFFVCGSEATAEIDFETEQLVVHTLRQEFNGLTWAPVLRESRIVHAGTASPIQMIAQELNDFLENAAAGRRTGAGPVDAGVIPARVMDAVYESSASGARVPLEWSERERESLAPGGLVTAEVGR